MVSSTSWRRLAWAAAACNSASGTCCCSASRASPGLDSRRCGEGNEREQHTGQSHQASSLLWVWMDIRMPKPAIRVTMEVPP